MYINSTKKKRKFFKNVIISTHNEKLSERSKGRKIKYKPKHLIYLKVVFKNILNIFQSNVFSALIN